MYNDKKPFQFQIVMDNTNENEKIEFDLLLQAIYQKYGYDFRNYARASLKRRIIIY